MPGRIHDAVFGELVFDEPLGWWSTRLPFSDAPDLDVQLAVSDEAALTAERLDVFRRQIHLLRSMEPALRRQMAERLLHLAEDWRDEDEDPQPMTLERFIKRVSLESLTLFEAGESEIYYADGDLFAGHVILVSVDARGQLTAAGIAG